MQTFLDKDCNSLTTVLNATPKNCVFDNNDVNEDDDDDDDDYCDIANATKIRPALTDNAAQNRPPPPVSVPTQLNPTNGNRVQGYDDDDDDDDEDDDENIANNRDDRSESGLSCVSNESEKLDLLTKLDMLRANGHVVRNFTLNTPLLELKKENFRLQHSIELMRSVKFQQKMLMAVVSALEYGNKRFDPFRMDLDGWSENIFENIEDYNHCFERLFEKYRKRGEMSPELELLLTLAGSAFMFNMSNQLFKSMNQPLRDIRNTVRSAFQQSQNQSQSQSQSTGPNLSGNQPSSLRDIGSSLLSSVFGNNTSPQPQMQVRPNTDVNVRNTQLQNFQNDITRNDNDAEDIMDDDRFSVASSSNDSIIEPMSTLPYSTASIRPSVRSKSKTKTEKPKSKSTQRTIVI